MTPPRLSPARIARSLVTVLVLTLIQSVVAPVLNIAAPEARAATLYENLSNFQQWTTWQGVAANHAPYRTSAGTDVITSNADTINLTQDVGSQTGFLWNTQVFSYTQDLTVSANYYFGAKDGADGIMFSMRPLAQWPNSGTAGSSTGSWNHWATGELRLIFDTYQNGIEMADDHLRVIAVTNSGASTNYNPSGTALKNGNGTTVADVEDNNAYPFTVKWTAASRTIAVYAGLEANHLIYSTTVSAADLDATQFSWGWMGFTGGASNYQSIANVTYHVGPTVSTTATDTTVTDGAQVTFTASYTSSESSPTTRWEYSTDGGSTWISTGTTTANYTFTATRALTQRKYRFFISSTAVGATYTRATTPVTLTVNPPILGSETDTALTFTGNASQRAFVPSDPALVIANAITIEAWVKPSGFTTGSWNMVVNKENSYELGITSSNNIPYWTYGLNGPGGWVGINTGIVATLDVWHHIAITRAASTNTVNFYLDGYLAYTGTADGAGTSPISDNGSPFTIGARTSDGTTFSAAFKGSIDQVLLFNSARTADEILSDMQSYIDTSTANLRAFYDFNEGSGTKIYNRVFGTTSATDLNVAGSPSFDDVKIVDTNSLSTYTTVKFPRSYLTQYGGWKAPAGVSRLSYLVVAGGGAGGAGIYSNSDMSGGGGGGGGVRMGTITSPSGYFLPRVGPGQLYSSCKQDRGRNSSLSGSSISTVSATGGGSGGCFNGSVYVSGNSGGSGGGAAAQASAGQPGSGNLGGYSPAEGFNGGAGQGNGSDGTLQSSGGGGGAAAAGAAGTSTTAGAGGAGIATNYSGSNLLFGSGGGGARRVNGGGGAASNGGGTGGSPNQQGTPGVDGQGGGGGGTTQLKGNSGGFGVIYVRWINASVPSYTKPTNAYLNVGMTETFTTNVAQDSATAVLTRTFKWESTTPTANGVYTVIKQGTGAANAFFSWVPTDTSTSGSGYLYRLTVTDSDTAGLFITDSSTAFAVINRALVVNGISSFGKTINVARSETFTITLGTSSYRSTLSPVIPGITLDTSTAGIAVVKISETMTVGTYFETLTVIDSVSASVVIPLTIKVVAPPTFSQTSAITEPGLIYHLDPGNSASYPRSGSVISDLSGRNRNGSLGFAFGSSSTPYTYKDGSTRNNAWQANVTCSAPTFSNTPVGNFSYSNGVCSYVPNIETVTTYTYDIWFKSSGSQTAWTPIVTTPYYNSNDQIMFSLNWLGSNTLAAALFDGSAWWNTSTFTVSAGSWNHATVTFDGTTLSLILNGDVLGKKTVTVSAFNWNAAKIVPAIQFAKKWDGAQYFSGAIGSFRLYNRVLTTGEIEQNYLASSNIYSGGVNNPVKSAKYGSRYSDTYTALSQANTFNTTFAATINGLRWDTSTALNPRFLYQDTLTVGTYFDTITVSDNYGGSSFLPITLVVSKADTLTISMDTATVINFNKSPITVYPKPTYRGLVGSDSLTVTTKFSSQLYSLSSIVPTNADTYTVIAADPIFSFGAASNYQAIVYETSTAVVNKISQRPLGIYMYGGVVGAPFLISLTGGDGDGAVSETLTGISSISGCAISNHYLTSTSSLQGFCEVLVVKAASQNYFSESQTVQLYFMAYINNLPTGLVGSGSTIALNGATSLTIADTSTVRAPNVTSLSTTSGAVGSVIHIYGGNFGAGPLTIKFNRNKLATGTVVSGSDITVTVPAGATTGPILVMAANGDAATPVFTVTP